MDDLEAGKLTECCELLNNISNEEENKKCFDCADNSSPRYLCTNFLTFVCSCCASIHQELGHKIKVLSVFHFTVNEIYVLKGTGNRVAAGKWLARWSDQFSEPDPTSPTYKEDARNYMKAKYIDKKWVKKLPPPLPIGENGERSANTSPTRAFDKEVSPTNSTEVSPRGYSQASSTEVSPRGYSQAPSTEVSPRKSPFGDVPPRVFEADGSVQQHDNEKQSTNPFFRDPYPTPPVVYSYIPQHMILPMSFPPGPYGYPQYSMPMELNQFPPYFSRHSGHFQPWYDNPMMQDSSVSIHDRPLVHQSCRELPRLDSSDEIPVRPPVLRSVSDNSLPVMNNVRQQPQSQSQQPQQSQQEDAEGASVQKTEKKTTSLLNISQKYKGVVSKMTGILKKTQN
jgi:hypothetical protein